MDNQTAAVAQRESRGAQQPQSQQQQLRTRATEAVIRAPVDIFEDSEGITLEADMPGVSKDRLTLRIDGETLVLEGKVQFDLPEHSEALYADVRSSIYRRNFALSRELDTGNIQAQLKDGVLKVRIPKRAELRPRKIEVQGA
jgi:HSP20 family molecular chaperone IbpA